jgi:hypothetical protein
MFAAPALKPFVRERSLLGSHVQRGDELLYYAEERRHLGEAGDGGHFAGGSMFRPADI